MFSSARSYFSVRSSSVSFACRAFALASARCGDSASSRGASGDVGTSDKTSASGVCAAAFFLATGQLLRTAFNHPFPAAIRTSAQDIEKGLLLVPDDIRILVKR